MISSELAMNKTLTEEDILENLSLIIGKSEFVTALGDVHFAESISVNGSQKILKVKLSDGNIIDITVKIK